MLYFTILFVFNEKCDSLFKVVCIQFFLTFFFTCDVSFFLYRCCLFLCFEFCQFPLIGKCYLEIYFLWTCICTVSKWEECGFGLNKIGSLLPGNRMWQPVILVEEALYYLSILTVIFSKDILLLYNYRKDLWYFHQRNWKRSKIMF